MQWVSHILQAPTILRHHMILLGCERKRSHKPKKKHFTRGELRAVSTFSSGVKREMKIHLFGELLILRERANMKFCEGQRGQLGGVKDNIHPTHNTHSNKNHHLNLWSRIAALLYATIGYFQGHFDPPTIKFLVRNFTPQKNEWLGKSFKSSW